MAQVALISLALLAVLLLALLRWHGRERQQRRARARVLAEVVKNRLTADTIVLPRIVDDVSPKQPDRRDRTPVPVAAIWPPSPVPRRSTPAAQVPRPAGALSITAGTGHQVRELRGAAPATGRREGRHRAAMSNPFHGGAPPASLTPH